jgi:hypothetical protein
LSNQEKLTASTNKSEAHANEEQSQPGDKDLTNTEETTRAPWLTEEDRRELRRRVAEHNARKAPRDPAANNTCPTARIPCHMIPPPAEPPLMAKARGIVDKLDAAHDGALLLAQAQMESQGDFMPQDRRGKADWLTRRREKVRGIMMATNVGAFAPLEPPPPVRPPTRPRSAPLVRLLPIPPVLLEIIHSNLPALIPSVEGEDTTHWPPLPLPGGGTTLPDRAMALIREFANRTRDEDRRLRAHSSNSRRWICTCMHACMLATFT